MATKFMVTPPEEIVRYDVIAAAFNAERMLRDRKFLVDLACGHKCYTQRLNRTRCPRCTEMLRRSIADGSEDYEGYRAGRVRDEMIWKADPCRQFNERTDLEGNFLRDGPEPDYSKRGKTSKPVAGRNRFGL